MATEITVPRLGWSMEEGTFAGWLKKDGETVKAGDPLFTLEGEKALEEVESLDGGILRIPADSPKAGDRVKVGHLLGHLLAPGESAPTAAAPSNSAPASSPTTVAIPVADLTSDAPSPSPTPVSSPPPATPASGSAPVTPRARRAASELGVKLTDLKGTGQGGRIRERDVVSVAPSAPAAGSLSLGSAVPITALRRTIAERMMQSQAQTAPVTLTCRVDATNLVALRTQFKTAGGDTPVPSYTDIIAKLCAIALQRHPTLAGRWDGERILLPDAIHIGIAVDTEHGLLVPVIRNVQNLSLPDLVRASRELIQSTQARRVKPEQLQGGVFTITNLGGFGIEAFTPIINFPETAVLGLGAIRREPVVLEDGHMASREQVMLSLTFDHRVVDGAPAARFLQNLRQGIENAAAWLLGAG